MMITNALMSLMTMMMTTLVQSRWSSQQPLDYDDNFDVNTDDDDYDDDDDSDDDYGNLGVEPTVQLATSC